MLTHERKDSEFEDSLIECYLRDKYGLRLEPIDTLSSSEQRVNFINLNDSYADAVVISHDDYDVETKDGSILLTRKRLRFPKTYAECCDVLSIAPYYNLRFYTYEHGYNEYATTSRLLSLEDKLNILGKLLICRNAYWKIAGEEMGLDEPWEPDWTDNYQKKFTICYYQGEISLTNGPNVHRILAFPTEEMRDTFYGNFKDLIELCKDLL